MATFRPTLFDNEISLLYKWASAYRLPVNQIGIRRKQPSEYDPSIPFADLEYFSLPQLINSLVDDGAPLSEIIDILHHDPDNITTLSLNDLILLYYGVRRETRQESDATILDDIKTYYTGLDLEHPIPTLQELQLQYQAFTARATSTFQSDQSRLDYLNQLQEQLLEYDPLPVSPLVIDSITLETFPTFQGQTLSPDLALVIFNHARATPAVPFLQLNYQGQKYYKIYQSPDIKFENVILEASSTPDDNTFYWYLWTGKDGDNPALATKESLTLGSLSLASGALKIRTLLGEGRSEALMIERISDAFPAFKFGESREVKVGGSFVISNLRIHEPSFLHLLLIQPIMNAYLYFEEANSPFTLKKRLTIHYRSLSEQDDDNKNYVSTPSSITATLIQHPDEPTVEVRIIRGDSRQVVNQFMEIFRRLMAFYMLERDATDQIYTSYIPSLELGTGKSVAKVSTTSVNRGRPSKNCDRNVASLNLELQSKAPDIFVAGYARQCQCGRQPTLVSSEEAETWRAQGRQVLAFPKDQPRHLFVCPQEDHPFPGVKENKMLSNREKYPYVPCCYKSDQTRPGISSGYNDYYGGEVSESKPRMGYMMKSGKVADPFREGSLPRSIIDIVELGATDKTVIRVGVDRSPDSFLHCVALALNDPNYLGLMNANQRNGYVQGYRRHMLATQYPDLVRQELFDQSLETIQNLLSDPMTFYDPARYYRTVEEMFQLNVFVFTPDGLELPAHALFHLRYRRLDRPTLLIYKHMGSESDGLTYPQCELIVRSDNGKLKGSTMLFGREMTEKMFGLMFNVFPVYLSRFLGDRLSTLKFPYPEVDLARLLTERGLTAIQQVIDPKGKVRALQLRGSELDFVVGTIPSQPLNLPAMTVVPDLRLTTSQAQALFGVPSGKTVGGLWFQVLDFKYGLFVPVSGAGTASPGSAVAPPAPFPSVTPNLALQLHQLQRSADLILQLIRWIWLLNGATANNSTFIRQFFHARNYETYNLERLSPRLPDVKTASAGMEYLQSVVPTLVSAGRFQVTPQVLDKLERKLGEWSDILGIDWEIPTSLTNFYQLASDFRPQAQVVTLMGETELMNWISSVTSRAGNSLEVHDHIDLSWGLRENPYAYRLEDKIYLIQNVKTGSQNRALYVSAIWKSSKVNLGFRFEDDSVINYPFVVYGISNSNTAIVIEDQSQGSTDYLQIVSYGSNRYGAMLPII